MRADDFERLDPKRERFLCERIPRAPYFPSVVGLILNEVRRDYARMTLPYREAVTQPSGVIHGGAIATLIDSVVVGAILSGYEEPSVGSRGLVTVGVSISYLAPAKDKDLVAQARIRKRGTSLVYAEVEVATVDGDVAHGEVIYRVTS